MSAAPIPVTMAEMEAITLSGAVATYAFGPGWMGLLRINENRDAAQVLAKLQGLPADHYLPHKENDHE